MAVYRVTNIQSQRRLHAFLDDMVELALMLGKDPDHCYGYPNRLEDGIVSVTDAEFESHSDFSIIRKLYSANVAMRVVSEGPFPLKKRPVKAGNLPSSRVLLVPREAGK
jgi:hypothetical protein